MVTRRWQSSVEPPPAGGNLPSIASSQVLRSSREQALRTPGLTWVEEDTQNPVGDIVSGRETRKMNTYQAVRDAIRYALTF